MVKPLYSRLLLSIVVALSVGSCFASSESLVIRAREVPSIFGAVDGKQVEVDRSLGDIPIYVRLAGKPSLRDLKDVASVLSATVVQGKSKWRISRVETDRSRIDRLNYAIAQDRIQQELAKIDRDCKDAETIDKAMEKYRYFVKRVSASYRAVTAGEPGAKVVQVPPRSFTPCGRLLRRLLEKIGPESLGHLSVGERIVFSNHPTVKEQRIPECAEDLEKFAAEESAFITAGLGADEDARLIAAGLHSNSTNVDPASLKVLVSVFRSTEAIYLIGDVYALNGELVETTSFSTLHVVSRGPARARMSQQLDDKGSIWVNLTDQSREFLDLTVADRILGSNPSRVLALKRTRLNWDQDFLTPDMVDPSCFVIPELLSQYAIKYPGYSIIARLPDSLWSLVPSVVKDGKVCFDAFDQNLVGEGRCELKIQGTSVLIMPINPIEADQTQADRRALGNVLRRLSKSSAVTLEDWCELVGPQPLPRFCPLMQLYSSGLLLSGLPHDRGLQEVPDELFKLLRVALPLMRTSQNTPPSADLSGTNLSGHTWDLLNVRIGTQWPANVSSLRQRAPEFFPTGEVRGALVMDSSIEPLMQIEIVGKESAPKLVMPLGAIAGLYFGDPRLKEDRTEFDRAVRKNFFNGAVRLYLGQRRNLTFSLNLPGNVSLPYRFGSDNLSAHPTAPEEIPSALWDQLYSYVKSATRSGPGQATNKPVRNQPPK